MVAAGVDIQCNAKRDNDSVRFKKKTTGRPGESIFIASHSLRNDVKAQALICFSLQPQVGCDSEPKVAVLGYLGKNRSPANPHNPKGVEAQSPRLPYSATLGIIENSRGQ
jgi:hypothetical protein